MSQFCRVFINISFSLSHPTLPYYIALGLSPKQIMTRIQVLVLGILGQPRLKQELLRESPIILEKLLFFWVVLFSFRDSLKHFQPCTYYIIAFSVSGNDRFTFTLYEYIVFKSAFKIKLFEKHLLLYNYHL